MPKILREYTIEKATKPTSTLRRKRVIKKAVDKDAIISQRGEVLPKPAAITPIEYPSVYTPKADSIDTQLANKLFTKWTNRLLRNGRFDYAEFEDDVLSLKRAGYDVLPITRILVVYSRFHGKPGCEQARQDMQFRMVDCIDKLSITGYKDSSSYIANINNTRRK